MFFHFSLASLNSSSEIFEIIRVNKKKILSRAWALLISIVCQSIILLFCRYTNTLYSIIVLINENIIVYND
jgi:hypothetical protein